jgi:hypothetical protein
VRDWKSAHGKLKREDCTTQRPRPDPDKTGRKPLNREDAKDAKEGKRLFLFLEIKNERFSSRLFGRALD